MARRKPEPDQYNTVISFEDALAGLESIVEAMEHEQLPLEELVACYEKGSLLLDRCESVLQSARNRIELITLRDKDPMESNGNPAAARSADISSQSADPDDSDDNDDIRLF